MLVAMIAGDNVRVHGKSQGLLGLPVRHEVRNAMPVMVTAWTPTPQELELLAAGANIEIEMWGVMPPPMRVIVGAPPVETGVPLR